MLKLLLLSKQLLCIKRSHTARSCTSDSLPILFVLNITSGEDTRYVCERGTWCCDYIAVSIGFHLSLDELGCWSVTWNGVWEPTQEKQIEARTDSIE